MEDATRFGSRRWVLFTEKVPVVLLTLVSFLLPLIIFANGPSLEITKKTFLSLGVLVVFVIWLVARLADLKFSIPRFAFWISALGVLIAALISSIFSSAPAVSFFGLGYEVETLFSLIIFFVAMFLFAQYIRSDKRFWAIIYSMFSAALVLFVLGSLHIFAGVNFFGFSDATANILGKWNDLGAFFAVTSIFSLAGIEFARHSPRRRLIFYILLVISLLALTVVNYNLLWWLLGALALAMFLYRVFVITHLPLADSSGTEGSEKSGVLPLRGQGRRTGLFLRPTFIVFLIAVVFLFFGADGSRLDTFVSAKAPTPIEVRPSWLGTWNVITKSFSDDPIFGVGPNRFSNQWEKYKPSVVNDGPFWNIDFNFGVGHLPTFLVTTGVLGILSWLIFLVLLIGNGVRGILRAHIPRLLNQEIVASFFSLVFLVAYAVLYVPDTVIFGLTFIVAGVLVGLLTRVGIVGAGELKTSEKPAQSFALVLVVIVLLIGSVSGFYLVVEKWRAVGHFEKGIRDALAGDVALAENEMKQAANLDGTDLYWRQLSDIYLARLSREISEPDVANDILQSRFISTYGSVIDAATRAVRYDETNYLNWLFLGSAYEAVVPLGISGAYDQARKTYDRAAALNPTSPFVHYRIARLEILSGHNSKAREALDRALDLKANYTAGLFLLSQLEVRENNLPSAIRAAEQAAVIDPNNIGVLFQLGLLKHSKGDYGGAIVALERAVSIQTDYANAKYFLGLSYWRVGRVADAIKQFEDILTTNPDQQGVKNILANLKSGRAPFAGIPAAETPDRKDTPPISE